VHLVNLINKWYRSDRQYDWRSLLDALFQNPSKKVYLQRFATKLASGGLHTCWTGKYPPKRPTLFVDVGTDFQRRLSAGLGLPTGADERQIRADFPKPSAGFQPPLPMVTNIKIARVTGEIAYCKSVLCCFDTHFSYNVCYSIIWTKQYDT